ncbi:MAG: hypothetical protein SGJ10_14630 [Bacteroidota bacterium]|nr:hypothetical protein [Bacteroidota bacterium]
MKTDNFDDSIRRKMDSINPQYTDADIDKVNSFVSKNLRVPFAKTLFAKAAVSVIGISIIGLTIWNIIQLNKQEQLTETINNLRINKQEIPTSKPDTVYIKETIPATSSANINNININKNTESPKQKYNINDDKGSTPIAKNKVQNSNTNQDRNISNPVNVLPKENKIAFENSIQKKSEDIILPKENKGTLANNDIKPLESIDSTERIIDSVPQPNVRPKKPSSKKYILAGIGGNMELRKPAKSMNVFVEYVFHKNFSAAAGVKMVFLKDEHFRDGREWRDPQGKSFHQAFRKQLPPDSNNIKDINIHNAILLQLPVQVSYRYSLNNKITLLASLATDVELYSKQKIDFTHRLPGPGNREERLGFEVVPKIPRLNNMSLAVGAQKQIWKNFGVQAYIYVNKQIISVPYRRNDLNFGARLRLFYSFNI